ncbi:hypothetical protein WR25_19659 isoform C [Diploscapter pachys]|nr:hypothetical protein WR25_19659 isoform B [Diploscapter pachys]PAV89620.1 hypothetical protein WR25_19659 isoform C [Diploscapter pachys]
MPRNMALVRRSTNRGERPAADSNHRNSANSSNESRKNDASQVVTEEDEDLMPSKLYMIRAEQDTDWQPSNSAVLKILFSLRLSAALWSTISDCDEVFNYWEPLHLLLFGEGLQTWEYSPVYAIRSYFYVYLHYMPARLLYNILPSSKIGVFLSMRCLISMLTLAGEFALYQAVCKRFCIGVGRFFVLFSLISTGMFISSSAFLPSSFAMAMNMLAMAAYLRERWFWAIFCTALSGLVGWPFAAILGLPIVIDMLFIRGRHHFYYFFYFSLISAIVIVGSLLVVDSYYYGKRAPLNIVLYNVFSPHGPDLYGVAPASFYVKNLLLNCNLLVLLAPAAFPLSICCYIHYFPPTGVPRKFRIPVGSYWNGYAPVFLLYLTLAFWCLIFFSQAHKEERFLFPVYPLITLMAAIALDALQRLIERFRDESVSNWLWVVVLIFCCVSLSRTYSLYRNFNGTMETYKSLNEHLMAQDSNSKLDFSVRNDPLRLCVGKEWHRFPSSFFLPHSAVDKHGRKRRVHLHFLKSEFRGLLPKYYPTMRLPRATQEIPTEMNDQNKEEPSRYVDLDSCDYVIDLEIPEEKRTELEPSYGEMTETFRRVASHPFLLSEYSHFFYRAFYVPYFTPKHTMTDEVQNNGDNSQEKEEEQLGNKSAESSKNAGAISKSVALSREVNRAARALVMESNKLITEDVLTLTKTYPACNALIEQQEIRIHNLMKKLMRKAGTGVQPPKLETAEVAQLIERTITATDNLCGDIHMIIDALDKAQRDEIVKIPKQVVGAESTRKHLTAEDKAAAIRRIATNLPSLLAQRMRQRDADMNTRKVAMHIEKPQKKYGFSFCIDNSEEPFKPKLVTKHHAKAPLASNLTVIDMDEGKGKRGKRTWQSDMAQSLHPYAFELEHLKIPEQQLNSKKPIKSINLENQEIVLVDSKAKLDELIGILNKEREFAVDLEHHCDRSFLGLCCLVQISTRTTDFIVDPFPIWKDMHALNEPFTDPNILKVFHGSSSDVDWLQRDFGIYVVNMFDTYW